MIAWETEYYVLHASLAYNGADISLFFSDLYSTNSTGHCPSTALNAGRRKASRIA